MLFKLKLTADNVSFAFLFCCEGLYEAFPHGGKANSHPVFVWTLTSMKGCRPYMLKGPCVVDLHKKTTNPGQRPHITSIFTATVIHKPMY